MHTHDPVWRWLVVCGAAVTVALAAWAAPIPPALPATNPTVRSLAELSRVRVEVDPLPPLLTEASLKTETLTDLIAKTLRDAGFHVATLKDEPTEGQAAPARDDEEDLPTVHLTFVTATDDKFADAISFCGILTVRQPADLRRIKQQMAVTTFTGATIGLVNKKDLRDSVRQATQGVLRYFTVMQRKAGPAP